MRDFFKKIQILFWWLGDAFDGWKKEVWQRELSERYCCGGTDSFGNIDCACGGRTVEQMFSKVRGKNA